MEVIILVGVARKDSTTPTTEMETEGFYVTKDSEFYVRLIG